MELSENLSINQLKKLPEFSEVSEYIRYFPGAAGLMAGEVCLKDVGRIGWNTDSLLFGLKRLEDVCSKGSCLFRIYSDNRNTPLVSRDVSLMFFPKTVDNGEKPFVIICPGGAFISVGAISEGFPVAARMNSLGYDVFILTYSVGFKASMPIPLDDLAAAIRFILNRYEYFGICGRYILGGFSAGGYMTALWGTDNHGYSFYGLPSPVAMFPIYSISNPGLKCDDPLYILSRDIAFAGKRDEAVFEDYNVLRHISPDYPPSFIVCGKNDATVPSVNSTLLKEHLNEAGVHVHYEMHENAPHGFGDGRGTDAFGWVDRACAFFEYISLQEKSDVRND